MREFGAALLDARWVIAFALLVFGANLGLSQMRGDAMIYAAVSQNLAQDGDPMHLTLNDEAYLNKPPLYFLLTAGVMQVVGTGAVGVKLGALLASTALCVLLYRSVRRIFDDRSAGMLAVFVFSATYVVYRNTYHARMESLLALCMLASVMCFLRWLDSGRWAWAAGWGLMAGLAVLTKGPFGLVPLAAGIVYLLVRERDRLRGVALLHLATGLLVCLASCGWWFALSGTELRAVFLGEQVLGRSVLAGSALDHRWWSVYAAKLFTYDLLWLVAAGIGVHRAWREPRLHRAVGLLLTAALVHLVLIHLVEEKTARYLYQMYAFTAGLSAVGILALRRFDAEHLLKVVIVVFAIGLQFTGTSRGRDHFAPLQEAIALGAESEIPLVADWREFGHLDEQAALDYYLGSPVTPEVLPERYLLVRPRANPMPGTPALFTSDRIWVGLVLGAPDGPGPVEPMHSGPEGSP